MERKLYRLGPDDLPIHDHGPVLENDKALHVERAQEIIDHHQHFQDPDREGIKSAEHIYNCLIKSVGEIYERGKKSITPLDLIQIFENAKLAEVNPWDFGRHLQLTLSDVQEIGKSRRKELEKLKKDIEKTGVMLPGYDADEYRFVIETNFLIRKAIELQQKPNSDTK